jgi:hypothetical protein
MFKSSNERGNGTKECSKTLQNPVRALPEKIPEALAAFHSLTKRDSRQASKSHSVPEEIPELKPVHSQAFLLKKRNWLRFHLDKRHALFWN